jgi:hypothetical protein
MKPSWLDLRQRLAALDAREGSFRIIAEPFRISESFLTRFNGTAPADPRRLVSVDECDARKEMRWTHGWPPRTRESPTACRAAKTLIDAVAEGLRTVWKRIRGWFQSCSYLT